MGILVASTKDQLLFYLTNPYTKEELMAIRNNTEFFCPSCGAAVILKIGQIKIPHFAHKTLTECDAYSEPESTLHLQGKLLLYQFFSSKNFTVELEKYLPGIRQRADLLVQQHTAIEFQCSPIPAAQVNARTQGYFQLGIQPIWIVGLAAPLEEGIQPLKLPAWKKELMRQKKLPNFIVLFFPEENIFYYYSNLFYVSGNLWIGKVKSLSGVKQQFPLAVPKKLTAKEFETMYSLFCQARRKFISAQFFVKNRIGHSFWRACYELQLDAQNLPETIGLPIRNAELFSCNAVLWQMLAIEASKKKVTALALVESGKIPLRYPDAAKDAAAAIETYLTEYERLEKHRKGNLILVNLLYDSYCKSV